MKKKNVIAFGILLAVLAHLATSDKILFLLPIASKSHVNVFEPLVRALGERGHEIVNLSPVVSSNMPKNVRQIQIYTVDQVFGGVANPFEMRQMGKFQAVMNGSFDNLAKSCSTLMKTDQFHDLVTKEKFDLVVVDIFMNYCVLGVVPLLQAPSILVTTFAAPPVVANSLGNRLPSSFIPDVFLDMSHKMTFLQRMANVLVRGLSELIWHYKFIAVGEKLYKENLPNGKDLPGVYEIQANASMVFMNSHFTLNHPRPLLPDLIEVGGMHTRPAKKLPQDIEEFLRGSGKDGFIFFSLGSIVPAKVMPEEYRKKFLNVFSRLKQKVIWKWETETMDDDVPPNVLLKKWLPQQDILGHPNIKIFITHGGLLSTQEAVFHGCPLIGIPIFGDQDLNVRQAESAGYAKFFEILDMTEDQLESTIYEVLNNTKYSDKAKELSSLVRDLPQTPLDKAVYWTEYVLRHKGARHLRSASRDLNFIQYYVIDVFLTLFGIGALLLLVAYKILGRIWRRLCGSKPSIQNRNKLKQKNH